MISRFAQNVASFFVKKKIIQSNESEIYTYGYEILISEAINWSITLVIALYAQKIWETVFYMLSFIRLREALGGFHAKTHMGCITISTLVYLLFLIFLKTTPIRIYAFSLVFGIFLHMVLTLVLAPVAHQNKPFSNGSERSKFRQKSIVRSGSYSMLICILMILPWKLSQILAYSILLGMLSASLSMAFEYTRQKNLKRRKIHEKI